MSCPYDPLVSFDRLRTSGLLYDGRATERFEALMSRLQRYTES